MMKASVKSPTSTNDIGTKGKQREREHRWPRMENEENTGSFERCQEVLQQNPRNVDSKPGMLFLNSSSENPLECRGTHYPRQTEQLFNQVDTGFPRVFVTVLNLPPEVLR